MTTRYMRRFFDPRSIAVIGASERVPSLGGTVLGNLQAAGFPGELMVVNRHGGDTILDLPRYSRIADLPQSPDLAIVCTPPSTIPQLVDELGRKGVRAVLIVMGGLSIPAPIASGAIGFAHSLLRLRLESGKTLQEATWEVARAHDLRIMGPNCMGVVVPRNDLNASYAHTMVEDGDVAYVGQSAMLGLAVADWAKGHGLGFSHLTTLGDSLDIDIADVLEYLEGDWNTRAILIHFEKLQSGARLMSALRAAARSKLVVVMKSRRVPLSQEPEEAIAAGLTNSDIVCDAALRRAGVLRVERIDEVFAALETLTRMRRLRGERLAIVCNGIGPGMLAVDRLVLSGGQLARLAEATMDALNDVLRTVWPDGNPVDLEADATPELFAKVIHVLRADPEVDAILVLHVPSQAAPSLPAAEATIASANEILKPVITCWMGQESAEPARQLFNQADISTFNTPEQAVDAFMHMVRYRRNQSELAQVPPLPGPNERVCQTAAVWAMVGEAVNAGRTLLSDPECDRVLAAAGIPAAKSYYVADAGELREVAAGLVPPFALKILSDAVCRPFAGFRDTCEHGRGVALDLGSVGELEAAAVDLTAAEERRDPRQGQRGFKLQRIRRGLDSVQLSMGITRDAVFGPLLFFGSGGSPRRIAGDRQVGLPPLNRALARMLIDSTAAGRALDDVCEDPEQLRDAIARMLVCLGQLVVEVPTIAALEINPLSASADGVLALDAKIELGEPLKTAILPYPGRLEETATLARSRREVLLRPIRAEDAPAHAAFVSRLSPETIRYRFFQPRSSFTRQELSQATQIDYAREMAFIATAPNEEGVAETLGVVRAWADADNVSAEFAVIVDDEMRGEGLGRMLLGKMIEYERERGVLVLRGTVLPDNAPMLRLAEKLGFASSYSEAEEAVAISLPLNPATDDWQRERLAQLEGEAE